MRSLFRFSRWFLLGVALLLGGASVWFWFLPVRVNNYINKVTIQLWSREETITYMVEKTGSSDEEVTREIERYVVNPGQATARRCIEEHMRSPATHRWTSALWKAVAPIRDNRPTSNCSTAAPAPVR
jgi:hypothetical protein